MNENVLTALIKKGETDTAEFKTSLSEWKEAIESLAAFSWAAGGMVIFGVSKSGRVTGADIGKGTMEKLANDIKLNTDPKIYPKISAGKIGGKDVIIVEVERVYEEPVLAFGRAYKRVGRSTHVLGREEYNRAILKKHEQEYDGRVCRDALLKDIDKDAVRWFRKKYKEVSGKELHGSDEDILKSLGCLKLVDGRLKPTNAGVLFFGKEPEKFFPRYYIAVARYPGKDIGTAYLEIKDIKGNLFEMIDRSDDYIKGHIETLYMLKEGQIAREPVPQYPGFVIRELITNAVAHRDYSIKGSKILIKIFKDRIEFDSPGGFPGNVNERNILEEQFSRNPIIVKVLNKVKYIEEMGEGWNRILETIKRYPLKFLRPPGIKGNDRVVATLFSPELEIGLPEKEELVRFNARQKRAMEYLSVRGRITRREYRMINKISTRTAYLDLLDLVKKNILKIVGKGRSVAYVLG